MPAVNCESRAVVNISCIFFSFFVCECSAVLKFVKMQNEFNGNFLKIVTIDLQDKKKLCFAKWANFKAMFQSGKKPVYKTSNYKIKVNWVASFLLWKVNRPHMSYSKNVIISTDQAKVKKKLLFLGNGQIRRTIWISTIFSSENVFCIWQYLQKLEKIVIQFFLHGMVKKRITFDVRVWLRSSKTEKNFG